jgi:hypothetical protein
MNDYNGDRDAAIKAMIQHYIPETVEDHMDM